MGIELVKKYNSQNKTRVVKVKCKSCGSTNVTGIFVDSSSENWDDHIYFNIKTGNIENFDGEIIEYKENLGREYYLNMLKDQLKKREELVILCRKHEDYVDVIEFTLSDGTKINSIDDFDLMDAYGFEDAIIYLLENDALEFGK